MTGSEGSPGWRVLAARLSPEAVALVLSVVVVIVALLLVRPGPFGQVGSPDGSPGPGSSSVRMMVAEARDGWISIAPDWPGSA